MQRAAVSMTFQLHKQKKNKGIRVVLDIPKGQFYGSILLPHQLEDFNGIEGHIVNSRGGISTTLR